MTIRDLRNQLKSSEVPSSVRDRMAKVLDRDADEAIRYIQSAVTRLASIIDGLLRLSRVRRVEYHWKSVDVGAIVQRIVESLHISARERGADPCRSITSGLGGSLGHRSNLRELGYKRS